MLFLLLNISIYTHIFSPSDSIPLFSFDFFNTFMKCVNIAKAFDFSALFSLDNRINIELK